VDVNSIPVAAVESIEVLKDGASALYGSDAVAGVVNIILRDDYQGMEVGGRYRFADTLTGKWEERSARATVGASSGKTSLTVSFEWHRADPLFQNDKEFSFNQTGKTSAYPGVLTTFGFEGTGTPGVYLLADGKVPPVGGDLTTDQLVALGIYRSQTAEGVSFNSQFNISQYVTLALGNERRGLTAALKHQVTDNIEIFGDFLFSQTESFLQLAAQPIFGMPVTAQNVTNFGIGLTNPDHPQNPFDDYVYVRNRFVSNPRKYYNDTSSVRGLAGIRGEINENLSFETAANINRIVQDYRNENVINRVNLVKAIDNGLVNLFLRNQDPASMELANIFGVAYSKNISTLNSFDARVVGRVPSLLPAGDLGFAVGAETRRETLSARPDAGSYTINDLNDPLNGSPAAWDGATTTDPFSVRRWVDSFFAEVRVPLVGDSQNVKGFNTLDLDMAVRQDRYSDSDDPVVPKASLRWMPFNDEFVVRASYSESFTAPSLYSLFGPSGVGFSDDLSVLVFQNGVSAADIDQAAARTLTSQIAVDGGFASQVLQPETAESFNFGFIWSPRNVRGLSVEVTYFRVEQEDIAGVVSDTTILQSVEDEGPASEYASRVRIGGFTGSAITSAGQLGDIYQTFGSMSNVYITNYAENFFGAKQDGVDVTIDYNFNIESIGRFDLALQAMWFNEFSVEGDDYVGTSNGQSVLNGGTIPRWTANLRADYTRGNWRAGFTLYHIPSVTDDGASATATDPTIDAHMESFTRVDAYVGYEFQGGSGVLKNFDGMRLRIGSTNLFDQAPPSARASWTDQRRPRPLAVCGREPQVLRTESKVI
jgi:iron complex outermembrane receptor protein